MRKNIRYFAAFLLTASILLTGVSGVFAVGGEKSSPADEQGSLAEAVQAGTVGAATGSNDSVDGKRTGADAGPMEASGPVPSPKAGLVTDQTAEAAPKAPGISSLNGDSASPLAGDLSEKKEAPLLSGSPATETGVSVVSIGEQTYQSLEEAVSSAEIGAVLQVTAPEIKLVKTVRIPAEKKLTLDLGGKTLTAAMPANDTLLYVRGKGSFTLKNGTLRAEDPDGDGFTGGAFLSEGSAITVDQINASGFSNNKGGGVLSLSDQREPVNLTVTNCNFTGNRADSSGGAIKIRTQSEGTNTLIKNNTIADNRVSARDYAWAGGISFDGQGNFKLIGNKITGNESSTDELVYGSNWSHGGGVHIENPINDRGALHVIIEGNTISNNRTQLFGGGIYFNLTEKKGDTIDIRSGVFEGNYSGFAGGAIDYSVHGQPELVLKNFVMTGNKALAGGGIWACPVAKVESHSTLGGAIVGNHLADHSFNPYYPLAGHDIQFVGSDTTNSALLEGNDPAVHRVTIVDRTFLGQKVNWYNDSAMNPYKDGDQPLDPVNYTDQHKSLDLYGKIETADWYEKHKAEAPLLFINNEAGVRGGVISSNAPLRIGEQGDVSVRVRKKWQGQSGKELSGTLPDSVAVQLVRHDEAGGQFKLEKVFLSEANHWTHTFAGLPAKGLVDGQVQNFTYSVEEVAPPAGFKTSCEVDPEPTEANYAFVIINVEEPPATTTTTTTKPTVPGTTTTKPTVPGTTATKPTSPGTTTMKPTSPGTTATKPTSPGTTTMKPTSPGTTATKQTSPGTTTTKLTSPGTTTMKPTSPGTTTTKPTSPGTTTMKPTSPGTTTTKPTVPGTKKTPLPRTGQVRTALPAAILSLALASGLLIFKKRKL